MSLFLYELFLSEPEPSLPSLIVEDRGQQVLLIEVGPQCIGKIELRVRRLPQKEVADSLLAARAYDEIGVGQTRCV